MHLRGGPCALPCNRFRKPCSFWKLPNPIPYRARVSVARTSLLPNWPASASRRGPLFKGSPHMPITLFIVLLTLIASGGA